MGTVVETIKSRLSILDVVGSYIKLERVGTNWKARCPFHNEKTPSFFVSPARDTYHCFGCSRGGGRISFVEEIEGLPFIDALKLLGERAGVVVVPEVPGVREEKDTLYAILAEAGLYYQKELWKHKKALLYLKERGLKKETLIDQKLGFAPLSWDALSIHLSRAGFSDTHIEKTGLVVRGKLAGGKEKYYDRFRGRIMFPIENPGGKTVGFSGRFFEGDEGREGKYINSPQTSLFDKSSLLYLYARAKDSIRKTDAAIVVEGQMDAITLHQAGHTNTVALSGTALTEKHTGLIKRLTDNIIFALDTDSAGFASLVRGSAIALSFGCNVSSVNIEGFKDPAECILKDPQYWEKALSARKHVISYLFDHIRGKNNDMRTAQLSVRKELLPLLLRIDNKIDQAHFIKLIAEGLSVPEHAIADEMKKVAIHDNAVPREGATIFSAPKSRRVLVEERIIGVFLWQESLEDGAVNPSDLLHRLEKEAGIKKSTIEKIAEDKKAKLVFETELCYKNSNRLPAEIEELFTNLKEEILREDLMRAMVRLKDAERSGEKAIAEEALSACQNLSRQLNTVRTNSL